MGELPIFCIIRWNLISEFGMGKTGNVGEKISVNEPLTFLAYLILHLTKMIATLLRNTLYPSGITRNGWKCAKFYYSRYLLVRHRIRREIGYNAMLSVCMCVCVSLESRLEGEIAYSADFFQSQVPRTKRYPVYRHESYTEAEVDVTQEIEQRAQQAAQAGADHCTLCPISCVTSTLASV